jgi:tetratricopeptide (TPR) repeat protein
MMSAMALAGFLSPAGHAENPPEKLTAEQQKHLEKQAAELFQAGYRAYQRGDVAVAVESIKRSLQTLEKLYPAVGYPTGQAKLAARLSWMGLLFQADGSYTEARKYDERVLAMNESLYPKDRYPQGHPDLAMSLNNLGLLLKAQGSYGAARQHLERALTSRSIRRTSTARVTPTWPVA